MKKKALKKALIISGVLFIIIGIIGIRSAPLYMEYIRNHMCDYMYVTAMKNEEMIVLCVDTGYCIELYGDAQSIYMPDTAEMKPGEIYRLVVNGEIRNGGFAGFINQKSVSKITASERLNYTAALADSRIGDIYDTVIDYYTPVLQTEDEEGNKIIAADKSGDVIVFRENAVTGEVEKYMQYEKSDTSQDELAPLKEKLSEEKNQNRK